MIIVTLGLGFGYSAIRATIPRINPAAFRAIDRWPSAAPSASSLLVAAACGDVFDGICDDVPDGVFDVVLKSVVGVVCNALPEADWKLVPFVVC